MIHMSIGVLSIHCVGVQTFEHSELKIKECLNAEIAHSFGPYSEEILNIISTRYIYIERYMDLKMYVSFNFC